MPKQLPVRALAELLGSGRSVYLLDVRQPWEHDVCALPASVLVPLDQLMERLDEVTPPEGALVIAYCHHGVRSLSAAAILEANGVGGGEVYSLAGGIEAWAREVDPRVARY